MIIEISEKCIPPKTTHHRKKIVTIRGKDGATFNKLGDTAKLVEAKNFWDTLFLAHRPERPLQGPLALAISLTWPWLTADPKKVKATGWKWHPSQPDLSNMAKTVEDSLGRLAFFTNDAQVCSLLVEKRRGDSPGVFIRIEEIVQ